MALSQSVSPADNYLDMNVTALVQDMINDPSGSFGFMLKRQDEQYYKKTNFASSAYTMKVSILKWGGSNSDVSKIRNLIESINVGKEKFCPIVYIPFSDEADFSNQPILSLVGLDRPNNIEGIQLNNNRLTNIEVNEGLPRTRAIIMITIMVCSDNPPADLPFRRCYCSRGSHLPDGTTSSQGTWSEGRSGEHCGRCGRANLRGICSLAACPGC